MKIIDKVVPSNFNLFLFGDVHVGSANHSKSGMRLLREMIMQEYKGVRHNFAVDHGDGLEGIVIDDKRYRYTDQPSGQPIPNPVQQRLDYQTLIWPFKDKIVTMLDSNHFDALLSHDDYCKRICSQCNIEYGTWTAKIRWREENTGELLFKSYHTHGRKTINSTADDPIRQEANLKLILKRHLKRQMGDCLLMCKGHTHRLIVVPPVHSLYLADDQAGEIKTHYTDSPQRGEWIHPDHRWYVNTGAFLKLFKDGISGYAERAEMNPVELGFAIAVVRHGALVDIDRIVI